MLRAYVHKAIALGPHDELSSSQRQELGAKLPRGSLRRMSDLGLLMGAVLEDLDADVATPLVLASTYAESRALEAFLDSFPTPSPTKFQTSVHPSSVQQPRVAQQAPLAQFIPMTGKHWLAITASRTALSLCKDGDVLLTGGEECGRKLIEAGLASEASYVFGLRICTLSEGAIGEICWDEEAYIETADPGLYGLVETIRGRQPFKIAHPELGELSIKWR